MTDDLFATDENNTALSPEEQLDLIPSLSTRAELNEAERANIHAARVWAMRPHTLKRVDLLTDTFARELHKRMFNQTWRWAGRYRKTEKNLGWEVARITEGMRNAFDDAKTWVGFSIYPLYEAAIRLHHRLVVIHPWPNGNGRHARLIADVMIAALQGEELTWGSRENLIAIGDARRRYIEATRQTDVGNFEPLLAFARS
ncbi:MAG TPA: mobile mystery protein B [Opitutaceae bacterium]|nr:mobile mystery protein B [Opitutaceae bacterium]